MSGNIERKEAKRIIRSLALGVPPKKGIKHYTSPVINGFIKKLIEELDDGIDESSFVNFVYGNYGTGKTHFLRLLEEYLLEGDYAVCLIEIKENEVSFDKLETVVIKCFESINVYGMEELGITKLLPKLNAGEKLDEIVNNRRTDLRINPDFLQVINHYCKAKEKGKYDDIDLLVEWFRGGGNKKLLKRFKVSDTVNKNNARKILATLAQVLLDLPSCNGLAILIDEAEKTSSNFTSPQAKGAYSNLKYIINTLDKEWKGIFFLFATTPDFYTDSKMGAALRDRIGRINYDIPKNPERILWNIEHFPKTVEQQADVFDKIINIYDIAKTDIKIDIKKKREILSVVERKIAENENIFGLRFRPRIQLLVRYLQRIHGEEIDLGENNEDEKNDSCKEIDDFISDMLSK